MNSDDEKYEKWKIYNNIHTWIRNNYGSATYCSNPDCEGTCKYFEWSLIPGKEHDKNVNNYQQLCKSCHRRQDMTPGIRRKIGDKLRDIPKTKEHKNKISISCKEVWRKRKENNNG